MYFTVIDVLEEKGVLVKLTLSLFLSCSYFWRNFPLSNIQKDLDLQFSLNISYINPLE